MVMSIGWFARTGADFMWRVGGGSLPGGLPIAFRVHSTAHGSGGLVLCPSAWAGGVEAERAGNPLQLPPLPSQGRLARLGRSLGRPSRLLYQVELLGID